VDWRFSDALRRHMAAKHPPMRPVDLAERLGITQQQVNDWLGPRGRRVSLDNLVRLARALEVSTDHLVEGLDKTYDQWRRDQARHRLEGNTSTQHKAGADVISSTETRALEDRIAALEKELESTYGLIRRFKAVADTAGTVADRTVSGAKGRRPRNR